MSGSLGWQKNVHVCPRLAASCLPRGQAVTRDGHVRCHPCRQQHHQTPPAPSPRPLLAGAEESNISQSQSSSSQLADAEVLSQLVSRPSYLVCPHPANYLPTRQRLTLFLPSLSQTSNIRDKSSKQPRHGPSKIKCPMPSSPEPAHSVLIILSGLHFTASIRGFFFLREPEPRFRHWPVPFPSVDSSPTILRDSLDQRYDAV